MIYLDYQATTPLAPEALDAMMPWLSHQHANPHSAHAAGRAAAAAVEVAREQIIDAMNLPPGQLIFTSGATEALNIAIAGAPRGSIVTVATEHAAVRDTVQALGQPPVLLPVHADGLVDLEAAKAAMARRPALVATMLVNNEIGVIQPVEALADLAHRGGALFLCDAVQGFGRVPLPPNADMIAISAHKMHGPKGIGALWLREGLDLAPLIHGGGQERGLRSGTLSPALCAGFGAAARLLMVRREADAAHVADLSAEAHRLFGAWMLNGSAVDRYPGNLNIRLPGLDAARLLSDCRGIAFSLGSACASGSGRPSHVLQAVGLSDKEARSAIRIGFGRYTTSAELVEAARLIDAAVAAQQLTLSE